MKELDEARRQIDQIILRCKAGEMTREKARRQILNLKGKNWSIAIVNTGEYTHLLTEVRQVIWEAE